MGHGPHRAERPLLTVPDPLRQNLAGTSSRRFAHETPQGRDLPRSRANVRRAGRPRLKAPGRLRPNLAGTFRRRLISGRSRSLLNDRRAGRVIIKPLAQPLDPLRPSQNPPSDRHAGRATIRPLGQPLGRLRPNIAGASRSRFARETAQNPRLPEILPRTPPNGRHAGRTIIQHRAQPLGRPRPNRAGIFRSRFVHETPRDRGLLHTHNLLNGRHVGRTITRHRARHPGRLPPNRAWTSRSRFVHETAQNRGLPENLPQSRSRGRPLLSRPR